MTIQNHEVIGYSLILTSIQFKIKTESLLTVKCVGRNIIAALSHFGLTLALLLFQTCRLLLLVPVPPLPYLTLLSCTTLVLFLLWLCPRPVSSLAFLSHNCPTLKFLFRTRVIRVPFLYLLPQYSQCLLSSFSSSFPSSGLSSSFRPFLPLLPLSSSSFPYLSLLIFPLVFVSIILLIFILISRPKVCQS